MLRKIRLTLAVIFFVLITLLFMDFTGTLHVYFGWMAKIQFLPAVLALNVGIILLLVVLTLIFGRIYCSVICPMGVMQDIIAWIGKKTRPKKEPTLFIFDEPTTGLHFHDIKKLLAAFDALIKRGHSILIIEHNLEMIKCADWVIDMGPEGGEKGGYVIAEGTPEDIAKCEQSYTGKFLSHSF